MKARTPWRWLRRERRSSEPEAQAQVAVAPAPESSELEIAEDRGRQDDGRGRGLGARGELDHRTRRGLRRALEVGALADELERAYGRIGDLEQQLAAANAEAPGAREEAEAGPATDEEAQSRIRELEAAVERLQAAEADSRTLAGERDALKRDVATLQEKLTEAQGKPRLKRELRDFKRRAEAAERRVEELEAQMKSGRRARRGEREESS